MSAATSPSAGRFIKASEAARRLSLSSEQFARVMRHGLITVRRLPGCRPMVLEDDVSRLAKESTTPASK
jgi:predicted site-specific integrase-resolvase